MSDGDADDGETDADANDAPPEDREEADADDRGAIPLDELARDLEEAEAADGPANGEAFGLDRSATDDGDVPDPSQAFDVEAGAGADGDPERRADAPLSDLADRVRDRQADADAEDVDEDLFEDVGVSAVDSEAIWETIEETEAETETETDAGSLGAVGMRGSTERIEREDPTAVRPDHIVPKTDYCQRCEHFSDPPEVTCTYADSDIVEVVDADHFRVRGCPKVADEDEESIL